jgi:hypothetical protein
MPSVENQVPGLLAVFAIMATVLGSCGLSGRQVSPQCGAAAFCARSPSFEAREVAAWRPRRLGCSHRR